MRGKLGYKYPSSLGPFSGKGVYKPILYAGSQQDSLYPPTVVEAAFPYLFHSSHSPSWASWDHVFKNLPAHELISVLLLGEPKLKHC